jgi:hypothetical protein
MTKTQGVFGYYNIIYIIAGLASDDINDIIIRTKICRISKILIKLIMVAFIGPFFLY